jgi:hypothetical protein
MPRSVAATLAKGSSKSPIAEPLPLNLQTPNCGLFLNGSASMRP